MWGFICHIWFESAVFTGRDLNEHATKAQLLYNSRPLGEQLGKDKKSLRELTCSFHNRERVCSKQKMVMYVSCQMLNSWLSESRGWYVILDFSRALTDTIHYIIPFIWSLFHYYGSLFHSSGWVVVWSYTVSRLPSPFHSYSALSLINATSSADCSSLFLRYCHKKESFVRLSLHRFNMGNNPSKWSRDATNLIDDHRSEHETGFGSREERKA